METESKGSGHKNHKNATFLNLQKGIFSEISKQHAGDRCLTITAWRAGLYVFFGRVVNFVGPGRFFVRSGEDQKDMQKSRWKPNQESQKTRLHLRNVRIPTSAHCSAQRRKVSSQSTRSSTASAASKMKARGRFSHYLVARPRFAI